MIVEALRAFPLVAASATLVGVLLPYAYDWLSRCTGMEIGFGGDKTSVFLGVFLGLPLGATVGLAIAHRVRQRRWIAAGEASAALLVGPLGSLASLALFATLGFLGFGAIRRRVKSG